MSIYNPAKTLVSLFSSFLIFICSRNFPEPGIILAEKIYAWLDINTQITAMENAGTVLQEEVLAIQSIYGQLINSWNEMNSEAYAALFTADGSIVDYDGTGANSRKEIYDHLSGIFADHAPARFVTIVREVRLLSSSVGLLRAVAGMVPRNATEIDPKTNALQSMVVVKQEQRFLIAHFQNTPAAFNGRDNDAKKLTMELQEQFQKVS